MRPSGLYATYRGTTYSTEGVGDTWVNLRGTPEHLAPSEFPDALEWEKGPLDRPGHVARLRELADRQLQPVPRPDEVNLAKWQDPVQLEFVGWRFPLGRGSRWQMASGDRAVPVVDGGDDVVVLQTSLGLLAVRFVDAAPACEPEAVAVASSGVDVPALAWPIVLDTDPVPNGTARSVTVRPAPTDEYRMNHSPASSERGHGMSGHVPDGSRGGASERHARGKARAQDGTSGRNCCDEKVDEAGRYLRHLPRWSTAPPASATQRCISPSRLSSRRRRSSRDRSKHELTRGAGSHGIRTQPSAWWPSPRTSAAPSPSTSAGRATSTSCAIANARFDAGTPA